MSLIYKILVLSISPGDVIYRTRKRVKVQERLQLYSVAQVAATSMHAEVSAIDVSVQLCVQWLNTTGMFIVGPVLVNTALFSHTHLL